MKTTRRNLAEYTDLNIVTTAENIAALARLARQAGALVSPTPRPGVRAGRSAAAGHLPALAAPPLTPDIGTASTTA